MRQFLVDLHVHTALSPCAGEEMTPPAIVAEAVALGLHVVAICDHNSAGNVAAVQSAARGRLVVLAGMEITTAEEVHVLGIFPDAPSAQAAGQEIGATLPDAAIFGGRFGRQLLMDDAGRILGEQTKALSFASVFTLSETVGQIKSHGGLAIASHIDRPAFGVLSQLGIFPTDAGFDAVEVTPIGLASAQAPLYTALDLPIVTSSDSHHLTDLGTCYSLFEMEAPTFEEIARTFRGEGTRRLLYHA